MDTRTVRTHTRLVLDDEVRYTTTAREGQHGKNFGYIRRKIRGGTFSDRLSPAVYSSTEYYHGAPHSL